MFEGSKRCRRFCASPRTKSAGGEGGAGDSAGEFVDDGKWLFVDCSADNELLLSSMRRGDCPMILR